MIEIKTSLKISPPIKKLLGQPEETMRQSIWSGLTNLVEEIEAKAVKEAPVKESHLVNSITSSVSHDAKKAEVSVTASYAEYIHGGTGLFGPLKRRIFPKTKKALFWPGAEHPVKSIKGMKPNPFLTRALKKIQPQKVFEDAILAHLKSIGI
jgi:hypothetical protein